ncbi:MAG: glycoside hydrolase family 3 N-terminal domain-containing protein [Sphingomicrobium sp.]
MTVAEKAGIMILPVLVGNAPFGKRATGYDAASLQDLVRTKHASAFSLMGEMTVSDLAKGANTIQAEIENTRLGIPALLATDPRHGYQKTFAMSVGNGGFSQWPDPTGFGAIGDPALVRSFAELVRRDYRAVGFGLALSPQADLATEPRWPRVSGTFGEDSATVAPLVAAYVEGLQGSASGVIADGIAATVKHWVGYGAAANHGLDSHNFYGRFAALQSQDLANHLKPFEAAFKVNVSSVMPAYSIFRGLSVGGKPVEPVGAGFSRVLIDNLLRKKYGFNGVVLSDWGISADCIESCRNGSASTKSPGFESISMAWGVQNLTRPQRFAKSINAGVDQLGGEPDTLPLIAAVRYGLISQKRLDAAVIRILIQRFDLGLFENPFVDVGLAQSQVGRTADIAAGRAAQAKAMVILEVRDKLHLIPGRTRLYLKGMDAAAARAAGFEVADDPAKADVAVIRLSAPYQRLHPNYFFGSIQHEGSLAFPLDDKDIADVRALSAHMPTVVDIYLDRPAILTPLKGSSAMLLVDFGASDAVLFDVLTHRLEAVGRLPFELPRSMKAVDAQDPSKPADSKDPLYPLHYSASY